MAGKVLDSWALVAFFEDEPAAATVFKARHRLSLADALAAALAKEKKAELVTGDPEFKALEKEIKIAWLPTR